MSTGEAEDSLYIEITDDTSITTTSNEVMMDQLQPPPTKPRLRSKSEQLPTAADQSQSNMSTGEAEDSLYIEIDDDISIATTSSGVMYFAREAALKSNAVPMRKQHTRRSAAQWFSVLKSSLRRRMWLLIIIAQTITVGGGILIGKFMQTLTQSPRSASSDTTATTETQVSLTAVPAATAIASKMYAGYVSMTMSGRVCQKWERQVPHTHMYSSNSYFPNDGQQTAAASNYCRDIIESGYLWCYTTDPEIRWDTCNVDLRGPHVNLCASVTCPQGTLCQQVNNTHHTCVCEVQALGSYSPLVLINCFKNLDYKGNVSKTMSGETCLPWINQNVYNASYFQADGTLEAAKNYCRYLDQDYLWCYTSPHLSHGRCSNELCGVAADPCNANAGLH